MALTVISSYPHSGSTHGQGTVGVASYAKNTIDAIAEPDTIVLAEKIPGDKAEFTQGVAKVYRCWKRNSLTVYFDIYRHLRRFSQTKNILIESELAMFGNAFISGLSPLFFLFLKLKGYRLNLVIHQVITDINSLSGHFGLKENSLKAFFVNCFLRLYYRLLSQSAARIIVFDEILKEHLETRATKDKAVVIPHGVETNVKTIPQAEAKRLLGLEESSFLVISFGFLSWYKGSDWLAETFIKLAEEKKTGKLLLAGGPNPNHQDKPQYHRFTDRVIKTARESQGSVEVTGFIPEEKIPLYYSAADLVIFPYRTLMSASGPLSLAFSFRKPFLLSKPLRGYLKTQDMAAGLKETGLDPEDLCFDLSPESLFSKITNATKLRERITTLSELLRNTRSWQRVGLLYRKELHLNEEAY